MKTYQEPDETKVVDTVSSDFDPEQVWIPREDRPEWNKIALVGVVPVVKGSPVNSLWKKLGDASDDMELWLIK